MSNIFSNFPSTLSERRRGGRRYRARPVSTPEPAVQYRRHHTPQSATPDTSEHISHTTAQIRVISWGGRRDKTETPGKGRRVSYKVCQTLSENCIAESSGKKTPVKTLKKIYRYICIYHVQFCYVYHHRGWAELRCPAGVKNVILANLFLFLFLFLLTN